MSEIAEAERLRLQAARCAQLAGEASNRHIVQALIGLASKSLERASDLERRAFDRQCRQHNNE
jgi:hypothetical protein